MNSTEESYAASLWHSACTQLLPEIGEPVYKQWFAPIQPLSLENNILTLGVCDSFFGDWFKDNYECLVVEKLQALAKVPLQISYTQVEVPVPVEEPVVAQAEQSVPVVPVAQAPVASVRPRIPEGCDHNYTFANFVVGDENQIACFSAQKAAECPGLYNPLFIYGDTALGKTHLLHATAIEYQRLNPTANVKYITTEQLLNDYTQSLLDGKAIDFRNRYREVDLLLLDDVQFLGRTAQLQEEFFNTFNALYSEKKQIVLTSDRRPCDINGLEDRLVSRFESGFTSEVIAPCFETRLAVLRKYRELFGLHVSEEVIVFIAQRITANIRRLRGAMNQIMVYEQFHHGRSPDVRQIEKMMPGFLTADRSVRGVAVSEIQRKVADHYHVKTSDLLGSRRTKMLALPRQVAMYLCRELTEMSFPDIAQSFGGKNHATVIHACNKIKSEMEKDSDLRLAVSVLERNLKD